MGFDVRMFEECQFVQAYLENFQKYFQFRELINRKNCAVKQWPHVTYRV